MSSNIINQAPYLRSTREFPKDLNLLSDQLQKTYIDIAAAVNYRTIGIYPVNRSAITGENYYINKEIRTTFRQVYTFTTTTAINHKIKNVVPGQFINCFGSYTNGTDTFGLPFGTSTATTGLITFYITSTQIVFVVDAGAPALTSGIIVLSWFSAG